ncbi:MAG: hypothetical protein DRI36_01640 [Caldiserica bacterium]|nr:MAG: hypothetical protein DRI36_01640 [Caldisericota bacterium]
MKVPSLSYKEIVSTLQRLGFIVVRQKGSHIRMQKRKKEKVLKIIIPAHRPVKRSTLAKILKYAEVSLEEFLDNL